MILVMMTHSSGRQDSENNGVTHFGYLRIKRLVKKLENERLVLLDKN